MRTAASEGQVYLNAQHQAEFYKIQEEAKSKTSKLRADHDSHQTAQVFPVAASAHLHASTRRTA
jgi:hypothetical protein